MSTLSTSIRPLAYSDLPQVIAIERRSFPTPWSLAMFVLELSKPSSVCLAAVERQDSEEAQGAGIGERARGRSEKLLAYLICSRYDQVWHLMNIAVDPAARRRGIARRLIAAMLEQAGEQSPYTLEVRTSNSAAIALYERFGFRAAGTRPRYYRDTGEDAMIMWRTNEAPSSAGTHG